ncbi:MAG: PAS domain S-box protein [Pseudomonadota bacterium]|nr:PAS domain S-box protein [Pseudomonadota bacterium]
MSDPDLDQPGQSKTQLLSQIANLQQRVRMLESLASVNEHREKLAEWFDLALWATQTAIWDWDLVTGEFWSSAGHQLIFGRGKKELAEQFDIEDEDNPWSSHLHPKDRERVLQCVRDHMQSGTSYTVEYRYRLPDGEYIWIRSIGRAVHSADGTPIRMIGSNSGIASQKLAEAESEHFREAVDNASEGIVLYDANERFVFANKRYRAMYPEITHLLKAGERRKIIRSAYYASGAMPDAVGRIDEFNDEFQQWQKSPGSFELRLANGALIKYSDYILPDGGIVSVRTDITNIKRREANYRALFDSETVGVAITRTDGSFVATNSVYQRMLGYSGEELQRMRWQDVSHAEDIDRNEADIQAMHKASGGGLIFEKRYIPKQGGTVWARLNTALIHDETDVEPLEVSLVENITGRIEAEQALRESESRFRTLFEDAAFGIAIATVDGQLLNCNPAFTKMLGYGLGELDNRPWSDVTHSDDVAENQALSAKLIRGEITSYRMEKRFVRKDGETVWALLTVSLVGDDVAHAKFRVAMVEDITEHKNVEDQLRQAQKMEAVGQLTGGVAHDFNNLLAVIMGNLELIESRVSADAGVSDMIERGVRAAERGAALTDRLLAFSRKQTLLPTTIDLNRLVAGTGDTLRRTLGERVEVKTAGAKDLWLCRADQSQLENALLNMSINARDAMPDGGTLTIETANIALDDEMAAARLDVEPGRYVMLSVSDTGSGISDDALKHVFEPFFTTKDVGKGSGLGLSMVYGFAKQSGGAVTVHSEPNEGTAVKLYLTALTGPEEDVVLSAESPRIPASMGETILVVEDGKEVRALAVALLSNLGYQTLEAETAGAAVAALEGGTEVHLMLTDVVLPGAMNGPELAAEVRRRHPSIGCIFMTGYAEDAFNNHGFPGNGAIIIQKPFRKFDFATAIRSALDDAQKGD